MLFTNRAIFSHKTQVAHKVVCFLSLMSIIIMSVVVNFLSQLIFIFPLFLCRIMYANEFETKEI